MLYTVNDTRNLSLQDVLDLVQDADEEGVINWASGALSGDRSVARLFGAAGEARIAAQEPRSWSRVDGTHTSDDGYTLRKMSAADATALAPGWTCIGHGRQWVVFDPSGRPVKGHPALVCGSTIAKAKAALERHEQRATYKIYANNMAKREGAERRRAAALVEEHSAYILDRVGSTLAAMLTDDTDEAAGRMADEGLLIRVRKTTAGRQLYALTDKGYAAWDAA